MANAEKNSRWAVVLVNLGTPDAPTTGAVRRYLREFLSDTRVIEIPKPIWWIILNCFVLTFRPRKSAHAYRSIWTEDGSPLMKFSRELVKGLSGALGSAESPDTPEVRLAMRYGRPAVKEVLEELAREGFERYLIVPMYPQYSAASSGAVFDAVAKALMGWRHVPEVRFVSDYYRHPAYIEAVAARTERYWAEHGRRGFLLFSFHGLPERSRELGDPYYDQCQASAKLIADRLRLEEGAWQVVFQSRFGPARWLQPYCIDVLRELPGRGITSVDVLCAGFAVDCLETLEEIAIANREIFLEAGGKDYSLIPALNDSPEHVRAMSSLIAGHLPAASAGP